MVKSTSSNKNPDSKSKPKVELTTEQFDTLMNRLNQLEQESRSVGQTPTQGTAPVQSLGKDGRPQGVVQKYPLDPELYPDPREDLLNEPALKRFNLKDNFVLDYKVDGVTYETKWGSMVSEPIFRLTLFQRLFDDEGNPRKEMRVVQRGVFTEDEVATRQIVADMGLDQDVDLRDLMNQARMYRYRTWLTRLFKPSKFKPAKRTHETVIDGKVVELVETETIL